MNSLTTQLVAYAHVADVERCIRFYSDLGFSVADSVPAHDGHGLIWAWLASGSANLMVGQADGPVDAGQQAVLFYLYCDDIEQAHATLQAAGHQPGAIRRPFYMPAGEFRLLDPDGYVLMMAQR